MKALFLILVPALLGAADITTSVTCSGGGLSIAATTNCAIDTPSYEASAYAFGSIGIIGNSAGVATNSSATGNYLQTSAVQGISYVAIGSVQMTETITTLGSGLGYVTLTTNMLASQSGGGASGSFILSYLNGQGIMASFCSTGGSGACSLEPGVAVQLGTTLVVTFASQVEGDGDPIFGGGTGELVGSASFNFFESDQTTAVSVEAVAPEPGTFCLAVVGGLAALGLARRFRAINFLA